MAVSSSKLASEVEAREKRLAELQAESNRISEELGHVAEIRDQAADAELVGDMPAANRLRGEAAKIENGARAREAELASLVPRLEAKIASTKSDLERAHFHEALARRDEKAKQAAKLARSIASALPLADVRKLDALRGEIDSLDQQARRLAAPLVADVAPTEDEMTFGDQAALDLLQAGPRQPTATAAVAEKSRAADAAVSRESRIETAVRDEVRGWFPTTTFDGSRPRGPIERLDEDLQPEAIKRFAKAVKRVPEQVRASRELRLEKLRGNAEGLAENAQAGGGAKLGSGPLPLIAA